MTERRLYLTWTLPDGSMGMTEDNVRMSFAIIRQMGGEAGKLIVEIVGFGKPTEAGLINAAEVTLLNEAEQPLFHADHVTAYTLKDGANRVLRIEGMDGDALRHRRVNVTVRRGATLKEAAEAIMGSNVPLVKHVKRLPRAQSFFGRLIDVLSEIAASTGAQLALENGGVRFIYQDDETPVHVVGQDELVAETMPTETGVCFFTAPKVFSLGQRVALGGRVYRVTGCQTAGDTQSGPWQCAVTAEHET